MTSLPNPSAPPALGWHWIPLLELIDSMKNGIYKPASSYALEGVACLRMYNIDDGRIVWRDIKRMRLSAADVNDYALIPGDLLVNRVNSRELVGKSAVVPQGIERCVFESKNIRVRLRRVGCIPAYVNYRLLFAGRSYFVHNAQQVVGMASISQPQLAGFPIPLAPLSEQRKIVEVLDSYLTRLDAATEGLKRVEANLKRYRASVLKAAVEGRLVPTEAELTKKVGRGYEDANNLLARVLKDRHRGWEESQLTKMNAKGQTPKNEIWRSNYEEPSGPETTRSPSLPVGWCWTTVEQLLATPLSHGRSVQTRSGGFPVLRLTALGAEYVNLSETKEGDWDLEEARQFVVQEGDFLSLGETDRYGSSVGEPLLVRSGRLSPFPTR